MVYTSKQAEWRKTIGEKKRKEKKRKEKKRKEKKREEKKQNKTKSLPRKKKQVMEVW